MSLLIYWILLFILFDVYNVDTSIGKMVLFALGFIIWVGHLIFHSVNGK